MTEFRADVNEMIKPVTYILQAGAYYSRKEAESAQDELKSKGITTIIKEV